MREHGFRFFAIFALILDLPVAIAMSITGLVLAGRPVFTPGLLVSILVSFLVSSVICYFISLQKISMGFARLFKLDPNSAAARIVGNVPVCALMTVVVGLIMTAFNVRRFPAFLFAFLRSAIPMYVVNFIVVAIFLPIALKTAISDAKRRH